MQVPFFSFKPHNPGLQPLSQCIQALDMPIIGVCSVPLTYKHNTGGKKSVIYSFQLFIAYSTYGSLHTELN